MRRTTTHRVIFAAALSVLCLPAISTKAGEITSISYTDQRMYMAVDFDMASDHIIQDNYFNLRRFDPSLGDLRQVRFTMTIVSADWSKMEVDNEGETSYYQELYVGGYLYYDYPICQAPSWYFHYDTEILSGPMQTRIVQPDSDLEPDFEGTDYVSYSGSLDQSKSRTHVLDPFPEHTGPQNDNPSFYEFVRHDESYPEYIEGMQFSVASAMASPYFMYTARRHTNGDVTIQAEVEYIYEVPEPATMVCLAAGGLALLRKRNYR
ncbi:MAG: PEP-CTERM sorting domain-containing protein [Phycisphaerae bacterium]|nr:PEP-CTERM sorting domain-containing protein [Phycisphaerae bacterium]